MVFITVRFGDDQSALFNPNCRNVNLLRDIKRKCDCNLDDTFDLSDESGEVANLWSHPEDNGKNFLTERGNFILVRVEREDEGDDDKVTYTPMLYGMENEKEFLDRLNPRPVKGAKQKRRGMSDDAFSPKGNRKGRQSVSQTAKKNNPPPSRSGGTRK
ncbi:hypothetical protein HOLleu_07384 [Holothuria leucospilota]|uniref:Uncharacterized protein n=1 Tax=Holothuria leucospilota TaxID=206669 RepID=A0A9Q1CHI4_HOLLE|nr:hypothetical protein HOLleu_07384 [Holothuria leucospilota]